MLTLLAAVMLTFGWEPHVAVSPVDSTIVVAANGFTLQISHDGGATFPTIVSPAIPTGYAGACGDGVVTFDSHGRLFWSFLACGPSGGGPGWNPVVEQIDPTNGAQIGSSSAIPPDSASQEYNDDKEWIAADTTSGANSDNVYLVWSRAFMDSRGWAIMFSRSTDHGATWSPAANLSASGEGDRWPSYVSAAPNGDVYVSYIGSSNNGSAYVLRSTQGGADFANGTVSQRTVAFTSAKMVTNPDAPANVIPNVLFTTSYASVSVVPDPSRAGYVYAVGSTSPSQTPPGDQGDILFARSIDNGMTWTLVNPVDDTTGAFQIFPSLAVDDGGAIIVSWYDTRGGVLGSANQLLLHRYAAVSRDSGLTFTANRPISPTAFDSGNSDRIGEYFGLAAGHGAAYAVWTGNDPAGTDWLAFFQSFPVGLPSVTSISPATGNAAGGTVVTINGSNFLDPTTTQVLFGGVAAATSVTINSATQITATAPAGSSTVHVRVTDSVGTSAATDADLFQYAAPLIPTLTTSGGGCGPGTIDALVLNTSLAPATGDTVSFVATHGWLSGSGTSTSSATVDATGHAQLLVHPDTNDGDTTVITASDATNPAGSATTSIGFFPAWLCRPIDVPLLFGLENLQPVAMHPIVECIGGCPIDAFVTWKVPIPADPKSEVRVTARVTRDLAQTIDATKLQLHVMGTDRARGLLGDGPRTSYGAPRSLAIGAATVVGPVISMDAFAVAATPKAVRSVRITMPWHGKASERPVIVRLDPKTKVWTTADIGPTTVKGHEASALVVQPGTYTLLSVAFKATKEREIQEHQKGKN